jgi:hypothetical protein
MVAVLACWSLLYVLFVWVEEVVVMQDSVL